MFVKSNSLEQSLAIVHLFSVGHVYHSNTNNLANNLSLRQVYILLMHSARDFATHVTEACISTAPHAR